MKVSSSEEENFGMCKCRRRIRADIMNEEVKRWTLSSKQQEAPPEPTKTKEDIRLEKMKIKVKIAALEWDDFVLQEQLKSLMYVDRSLRTYPKKDKLIDELNFKKLHLFKYKDSKKVICWYYIQKRKFYSSS